jgi:hypothetical protein
LVAASASLAKSADRMLGATSARPTENDPPDWLTSQISRRPTAGVYVLQIKQCSPTPPR